MFMWCAVGVLSVSWYPPGQADTQGSSWDDMVHQLLDTAEKYELKVRTTLEPYNYLVCVLCIGLGIK